MLLTLFKFVAVAFLPSISCNEPPIISTNTTHAVVVLEGNSLEFECYTKNNESSKITWKKDYNYDHVHNDILSNGETTYNGNILKFTSVTIDQRGQYICTAENMFGTATRFYILDVEFKPEIKEIHRVDHIGNDIELSCSAIGYPPSAITWMKNDQELSNNKYHKIVVHDIDNSARKSTLTITMKDNNYYGTYKCLFANQYGIDSKYFEILEPNHNCTTYH